MALHVPVYRQKTRIHLRVVGWLGVGIFISTLIFFVYHLFRPVVFVMKQVIPQDAIISWSLDRRAINRIENNEYTKYIGNHIDQFTQLVTTDSVAQAMKDLVDHSTRITGFRRANDSFAVIIEGSDGTLPSFESELIRDIPNTNTTIIASDEEVFNQVRDAYYIAQASFVQRIEHLFVTPLEEKSFFLTHSNLENYLIGSLGIIDDLYILVPSIFKNNPHNLEININSFKEPIQISLVLQHDPLNFTHDTRFSIPIDDSNEISFFSDMNSSGTTLTNWFGDDEVQKKTLSVVEDFFLSHFGVINISSLLKEIDTPFAFVGYNQEQFSFFTRDSDTQEKIITILAHSFGMMNVKNILHTLPNGYAITELVPTIHRAGEEMHFGALTYYRLQNQNQKIFWADKDNTFIVTSAEDQLISFLQEDLPSLSNIRVSCLPSGLYNEFILINPQKRDNQAIYSKKSIAIGLLDKNDTTIFNICINSAYNVDKLFNLQ